MPVKNRFAELQEEITEWRHDFHANPEILFETHRTSKIVDKKLKSFGCVSFNHLNSPRPTGLVLGS